MKRKIHPALALFVSLIFTLSSCSYNPFISNNHLTGSATSTAVGAGIGAGTIALLGGTRYYILGGGLLGGTIGYYVSTLRYDSGGIIQAGGKVYRVGDMLGIYIETEKLFEPNTDIFIPSAKPILDSAVAVLKHFPSRQILVSSGTSGFYRAWWEQKLSEKRAQRVAAYFWNAGIGNGNYVGYDDYFPIAKSFHNRGIRENSRIQITSYPSNCELYAALRPKSIFNVIP